VRSIVVTGASRGLGSAIATSLAEDPEHAVFAVSRSGLAPPGCTGIACDVGDHASVRAAFASLQKDGNLYALINAAGVASMNLAMATPPETIERIIRTNLIGTINCCIGLSKRFGRNRAGRIVNFSTIAVPLSLKGEAVYVASKAGVEGFSKTFAREMADFGVNVNVIAPGPIDTDLIAGVPASSIDKIVKAQIIPRKFEKDAVVKLVHFLLGEQSDMLSGQVLNVGGA